MEWKKIAGWNYSISSEMEVRNDAKGNILKQHKQKRVVLYRNGTEESWTVLLSTLFYKAFGYYKLPNDGREWRHIKNATQYALSKDKVIINAVTGRKLKPSKKNIVRLTQANIAVHLDKLYSDTFGIPWSELLEEGEEVKPVIVEGIRKGDEYITSFGRLCSGRKLRFVRVNHNMEDYYTEVGGYYSPVGLKRIDETYYNTRLHTLVGRAFLSDYKQGLLICHKDETLPPDEINRVENLFIGDHKINGIDMVSKGRGRWQTCRP